MGLETTRSFYQIGCGLRRRSQLMICNPRRFTSGCGVRLTRKDSSTAPLVGLKLGLFIAVLGLTGLITNAVQAGLISGWGLEPGGQNATLTEGAPGSFSTTTPTGDARARASLPASISFNVGEQILLSGTVTLQNSPGNQQFRWGLF